MSKIIDLNGRENGHAGISPADFLADIKFAEAEFSKSSPVAHSTVSTTSAQGFDLATAILASRVSIDEQIDQPVKCLSITGFGETSSTIATLGNFSLVYGKAKSKKSFLIQLFVNAALNNGKEYSSSGLIVSSLPVDKQKIMVLDTEQGRYRSQRILKRAQQQLEIAPDNLIIHDLRKYTPAERLQISEYLVNTTVGLGLVVIDGIRDLVTSINDEEQSTAIASKLLKWTEERQIHICLVLHQNKGDNNARGHLGTELVNKAETALSITKDVKEDNLSIVEAEACRDKEFKPFAFQIDTEGLPQVAQGWTKSDAETKSKGAWKPEDIKAEQHTAVLKEIWPEGDSTEYKKTHLEEKIRKVFLDKFAVPIAEKKASRLIVFYEVQKLVTKREINSQLVMFGAGEIDYLPARVEPDEGPENLWSNNL